MMDGKSTSNNNVTAEQIIEQAKIYRNSNHRPMTYADYERFKAKMHNACIFGHEHELADALGV